MHPNLICVDSALFVVFVNDRMVGGKTEGAVDFIQIYKRTKWQGDQVTNLLVVFLLSSRPLLPVFQPTSTSRCDINSGM